MKHTGSHIKVSQALHDINAEHNVGSKQAIADVVFDMLAAGKQVNLRAVIKAAKVQAAASRSKRKANA